MKKRFLLLGFLLVGTIFLLAPFQTEAAPVDNDGDRNLQINDVTSIAPGGSTSIYLQAPQGTGFTSFKNSVTGCESATSYGTDGCYAWIGLGGVYKTFVSTPNIPAGFSFSSTSLSPSYWGQSFTLHVDSDTPAGTYSMSVVYTAGRWTLNNPPSCGQTEPCSTTGVLNFTVTVVDPSSLSLSGNGITILKGSTGTSTVTVDSSNVSNISYEAFPLLTNTNVSFDEATKVLTVDTSPPDSQSGDVKVTASGTTLLGNPISYDLFVPITVTQPDLIPTSISAPSSAVAGSTISVTATLVNSGNGSTGGGFANTFRFDPPVPPGCIGDCDYIGSSSYELVPSSPSVTSINYQIPVSGPTGTWTVQVCVGMTATQDGGGWTFTSPVAESNTGNNCSDTRSFEVTSAPTCPSVTTSPVTNIATTTATGGGNVTSNGGATVTQSGIVWIPTSATIPPTTGTYAGKTTDGAAIGSWSSNLTSLNPNTSYVVRAYATNSVDTCYGSTVTFTSSSTATAPSVTTSPVTNIATTTATGGGNVTSNGGATVTQSGIVWIPTSATIPPTTGTYAGKTTDGAAIGSWSSNLTSLNPNTSYVVRAYATNSVDTSYGDEVTFMTASPTAMTGSITGPSSCTINSGESSCNNVSLSWEVLNPVSGNSALTSSYPSTNTVVDGDDGSHSGTVSVTIPYSSRYFELYNNEQVLSTKSVSALCTSGTEWNSSSQQCLVPEGGGGGASGSISVSSTSCSIPAGQSTCTVYLTWGSLSGLTIGAETEVTHNNPSNTSVFYDASYLSQVPSGSYFAENNSSYGKLAEVFPGLMEELNLYLEKLTNWKAIEARAADVSVNLSSNKTSIVSGNSATLSWSYSDVSTVDGCGKSGGWSGYFEPSSSSGSGSQSVSPTSTTSYTLTCAGPGGPASDSVTIGVAPPVSASISASDTSITSGESTTLSWSSSNAIYGCVASGGWSGGKSASGSQSVSPSSYTTYTITCNGLLDSDSDSVSVSVSAPSPSGSLSFSSSSCTISSGQSTCSVEADWSTQNASDPKLEKSNTPITILSTAANNAFFPITVYYPNTSFRLKNGSTTLDSGAVSASCASGTTWNGSICSPLVMSGSISDPSPCTISLNASSCNVSLTWSVTNPLGSVSALTSSYPSGGTLVDGDDGTHSGTVSVAIPYSSRTFYLYNSGQQLAQRSISSSCTSGAEWNGSNCVTSEDLSRSNYPSSVTHGDTVFFLYHDGALLDQTDTVTATCASGTWNGVICEEEEGTPPNPAPVSYISVDPSSIVVGNLSTLTWSSTNATSCTGTNFSTEGFTSGSIQVSPSVTTDYTVLCTGPGGQHFSTATLTVTTVPAGPSGPSGEKQPIYEEQ